MSVVTLNVHFDGPADAATLSWVGNDGAEVKYCDVRRGGEVRQETFAGHEWVLRSKGGGDELARFVAAAEPALQEHRVPADAAADAADAAGDARDGGAAARREEDVGGDEEEARAAWAGVDCRFERLSRPDRRGRTMWREIGPDGSEVGRHVQLEASCHTRWVWWLDQAFAQLRSLSNDREAYLFYAMTFASAWQLDSAARKATKRLGLGDHPLVALALLLLLLGACVAAALPLTESQLLLVDERTRREMRLCDGHGSVRDAAGRPWQRVGPGKFEAKPRDLRKAAAQRQHHYVFMAVVAGYFALRLAAPVEGA